MEFLPNTRVSSSFVLLMSLVLGSLPSVGRTPPRELPPHMPARSETLHLKEGASITVIKTSSGDLTAREDSYANAMSQAFSQQKECSTVKLQDSGKTSFTVQFYVAHLLEQYTVSYAVVDQSGSVIKTGTTNSLGDTAEKVCELIRVSVKEPREPKCSPRGKGRTACDPGNVQGPRKMMYY